MRNDTPAPIRCAVCGCTGPQAKFRRPGWEDMNWVENSGQTYMVCNDHIDTVWVVLEPGLHGQPFVHNGPVFYSESTLRDLERRIQRLEQAQ